MIHEFLTLRVDDFDNEVEDLPAAILMEQVESVYQGTAGRSKDNTVIVMKSGDTFTTRLSYREVVDIWLTCTEPLNLNSNG